MNHLTNIIFTFLLLNPLTYCQAQEQNLYPDSVQARISQVETGLTEWGKTHYEFQKSTLEEFMEDENVPGLSIVVMDNYKIEWAKAYGLANNKAKTPVTTETTFNAASISKMVNAIAILKLAENGQIDLAEDINHYLTSWKFQYTMQRPITTYQLLSHTAGLTHIPVRLINSYRKPPSVIEVFAKKGDEYTTSKYNPGQRFSYSNAGISISQLLLTDITGSAYSQKVDELVFRPIGMNNSFYLDRQNETLFELASGHWKKGKRLTHKHPMVAELAPSGLWATPTDLAKLVIELQLSLTGNSNKILSKQSTELILTPAKQQLPHNYVIYGGLGSFIENRNGVMYFQHEGSGLGFGAALYGSYEDGKGVIVMANLHSFSLINAIVSRVAAVYKWEKFLFNNGMPIDSVEISNETLSKYVGKFKNIKHPSNKLEITLKNGKPHIQLSGGDSWYLDFIPLSQSIFWAENIPNTTTLEFLTDDNGEVNTLILSNHETSEWIKMIDDKRHTTRDKKT